LDGTVHEGYRASGYPQPEENQAMDEERTRPAPAPTGDPRVDQAIAGLSTLEEMDLDQRPAALEVVHDRLREILGELGDAAEPGRHGEQGQLGTGGRR
jgi:hypothetical protein